MTVDVKTKSDAELESLITKTGADVDAAIRLLINAETEKKDRAVKRYEDALALVKARAKEAGRNIAIQEIGRKSTPPKKAKYPNGTVYRHKENHAQTWTSGKGKAPWWMAEYGEAVPAESAKGIRPVVAVAS